MNPASSTQPSAIQWETIRRRSLLEVRWQRFRGAMRWALAVAIVGVLLILLLAYYQPEWITFFKWVLGVLILLPLITGILTWLLPPSHLSLLSHINHHFHLTDDAFAAEEACHHESAWHTAILHRATGLVRQQDWRQCWPRTWPRGSVTGAIVYLTVLVLALFALPHLSLTAETSSLPSFNRDAVEELANALAHWSDEIRPPDEFKQKWEEMQQKFNETKQELLRADLTERELILSLNKLEQQLDQWNQAVKQASAEQSAWQNDISKALDELENFAEATNEMRKGNLEEAADLLDKAAGELKQNPSSLKTRGDAQQAQKNLQALSDKLKKQNMDSAAQATEELSQSLQNNEGKQDGQKAAQAAQALSQSARETAGKQSFLKSLKNMQQGMASARDQAFRPQEKDGGGSGQENSQEGEQNGRNGEGGNGKQQGEDNGDKTGRGIGSSSGSRDGEGEVEKRNFSNMDNLTGDPSNEGAQTSHTIKTENFSKESTATGASMDPTTFENLSREAIEDESIPLVHRDTIRRYFESIRPRNQE